MNAGGRAIGQTRKKPELDSLSHVYFISLLSEWARIWYVGRNLAHGFFFNSPDLSLFSSFPGDVIPEVLTKGRTIRDLNGTHGDPCARTGLPHHPDRNDETREGESPSFTCLLATHQAMPGRITRALITFMSPGSERSSLISQ